MNNNRLIDNNNRVINYLRLSVTDRCNLRCMYCMPEKGINFVPHSEILRFEEILHIVRLAVRKGIRKVRITGGEPLVRKGLVDFLKKLNHIQGLEEVTLTTNGVLLKEFASRLKESGIKRINISLDSLKPERFSRITGKDCFDRVWEGIQEAERLGFFPIKINVVALRGVNDDEILDFARLTLDKPYGVRFIEHMPVGAGNGWDSNGFLSCDEIHKIIQQLGPLNPVKKHNILDGPARRFRFEKAKGEIGLIGALSNHFCKICNRLRLTAEGHLRSCLFSDEETDIKSPLRQGKDDDHLMELIETAIKKKPEDHGMIKLRRRTCERQMSSIGG